MNIVWDASGMTDVTLLTVNNSPKRSMSSGGLCPGIVFEANHGTSLRPWDVLEREHTGGGHNPVLNRWVFFSLYFCEVVMYLHCSISEKSEIKDSASARACLCACVYIKQHALSRPSSVTVNVTRLSTLIPSKRYCPKGYSYWIWTFTFINFVLIKIKLQAILKFEVGRTDRQADLNVVPPPPIVRYGALNILFCFIYTL